MSDEIANSPGIDYGDNLMLECFIQACTILLANHQALVVSPSLAHGKLILLFKDEANETLIAAELRPHFMCYDNEDFLNFVSHENLKIGDIVWIKSFEEGMFDLSPEREKDESEN